PTPAKLDQRSCRRPVGRITLSINKISDMNNFSACLQLRHKRTGATVVGAGATKLCVGLGHATERDRPEPLPIGKHQTAKRGVAKFDGLLADNVENGSKITR